MKRPENKSMKLIKKLRLRSSNAYDHIMRNVYVFKSYNKEMCRIDHDYYLFDYNNKYTVIKKSYTGEKICNLNDLFSDWQNPTKLEVAAFELETGLKYITHYLKLEPWDDEEE